MEASTQCSSCNGTGIDQSEFGHGRECCWCHGLGTLPAPDLDDILRRITTTRGGKKFRKSFTSYAERGASALERVLHARAYYVWRLARFHGGADVTMPVVADMVCGRDPYKQVLDAIADQVAKQVFGTNLGAAYRWASALGYNVRAPEGLPAAAYPNGPVHDGNKPIEELAEAM